MGLVPVDGSSEGGCTASSRPYGMDWILNQAIYTSTPTIPFPVYIPYPNFTAVLDATTTINCPKPVGRSFPVMYVDLYPRLPAGYSGNDIEGRGADDCQAYSLGECSRVEIYTDPGRFGGRKTSKSYMIPPNTLVNFETEATMYGNDGEGGPREVSKIDIWPYLSPKVYRCGDRWCVLEGIKLQGLTSARGPWRRPRPRLVA